MRGVGPAGNVGAEGTEGNSSEGGVLLDGRPPEERDMNRSYRPVGWHILPETRVLSYNDGRTVRPGETLTVPGPAIVGQHGLHAALRIHRAMFDAAGDVVCRVRVEGQVDRLPGGHIVAGTERTCLWMVDGWKVFQEGLLDAIEWMVGNRVSGLADAIAERRAWLETATRESTPPPRPEFCLDTRAPVGVASERYMASLAFDPLRPSEGDCYAVRLIHTWSAASFHAAASRTDSLEARRRWQAELLRRIRAAPRETGTDQ